MKDNIFSTYQTKCLHLYCMCQLISLLHARVVDAWATRVARLRCLFYDAKHVHKYVSDKGNEMTLRILVIRQ